MEVSRERVLRFGPRAAPTRTERALPSRWPGRECRCRDRGGFARYGSAQHTPRPRVADVARPAGRCAVGTDTPPIRTCATRGSLFERGHFRYAGRASPGVSSGYRRTASSVPRKRAVDEHAGPAGSARQMRAGLRRALEVTSILSALGKASPTPRAAFLLSRIEGVAAAGRVCVPFGMSPAGRIEHGEP